MNYMFCHPPINATLSSLFSHFSDLIRKDAFEDKKRTRLAPFASPLLWSFRGAFFPPMWVGREHVWQLTSSRHVRPSAEIYFDGCRMTIASCGAWHLLQLRYYDALLIRSNDSIPDKYHNPARLERSESKMKCNTVGIRNHQGAVAWKRDTDT